MTKIVLSEELKVVYYNGSNDKWTIGDISMTGVETTFPLPNNTFAMSISIDVAVILRQVTQHSKQFKLKKTV